MKTLLKTIMLVLIIFSFIGNAYGQDKIIVQNNDGTTDTLTIKDDSFWNGWTHGVSTGLLGQSEFNITKNEFKPYAPNFFIGYAAYKGNFGAVIAIQPPTRSLGFFSFYQFNKHFGVYGLVTKSLVNPGGYYGFSPYVTVLKVPGKIGTLTVNIYSEIGRTYGQINDLGLSDNVVSYYPGILFNCSL